MRNSLFLCLTILILNGIIGISNVNSNVDADSSFSKKDSKIPFHTVFEGEASVTAEGDIQWYRYTIRVKLADRDKVEKRNPRGTWGSWVDEFVDGTVSVNDSCRKFRTSWISQDRLATIEVLYTDLTTDTDTSPDPNEPLCKGCWQEGVDHKVDCPCGTPYYTCRTDQLNEHAGHANNNQGISPTDPKKTPSPGYAYGLQVDTGEPYYHVQLFARGPWQTSGRGDSIGSKDGDGTKTVAEFTYTPPSGSMNAGDYLITAVIMRWSDMSEYEITSTVTVQLLGIYPTDTVALGASPGSEFELNVITDDHYYWIDWYVKRQGETGRGIKVGSSEGGTTNLGTMRYTYNEIGTYVITAVITRGTDMTEYEQTYTLLCDS